MLNLVDYSVSGFPLLFVGFLECLAVNWIYGRFQVNTCRSVARDFIMLKTTKKGELIDRVDSHKLIYA